MMGCDEPKSRKPYYVINFRLRIIEFALRRRCSGYTYVPLLIIALSDYMYTRRWLFSFNSRRLYGFFLFFISKWNKLLLSGLCVHNISSFFSSFLPTDDVCNNKRHPTEKRKKNNSIYNRAAAAIAIDFSFRKLSHFHRCAIELLLLANKMPARYGNIFFPNWLTAIFNFGVETLISCSLSTYSYIARAIVVSYYVHKIASRTGINVRTYSHYKDVIRSTGYLLV